MRIENEIVHQSDSGVLYLGDCLDVMRAMADNSVDAVITDPPYGILSGNKIESNVDIDEFYKQAYRVLKADAFIAFFGQYPTLPKWTEAAERAGFTFVEHISWIKRVPSSPFPKLQKVHESFMIYKKGKAQYIETKGNYEDVKVPGVAFDTVSIEGIKRYIGYLWQYIDRGEQFTNKGQSQRHKNAIFVFATNKHEAPRQANFTNVWSFLSNNQAHRAAKNNELKGHSHPTVKSTLFMERAVGLLTKPGDVVLDAFAGSGTTLEACIRQGRKYIGIEILDEFTELIKDRLENLQFNTESKVMDDIDDMDGNGRASAAFEQDRNPTLQDKEAI